ncbi:MAG: DUF6531 domain-containing protein [Gammaproteobacteria bacterium]|nr:DUF6531 domain-containing protein [Gammaproteobacteria bacterium]
MAEETLQGNPISQQAANLLKNGVDSEKYKGDKTGIRCHPSTHYIELAYFYDDIDKTPAAYVPYTLKFADNSTRNGTLDESGYALEDLVPVGPVSVQYGDSSADETQAEQLRQEFKQSLDQFIAQMERDKKFQDMVWEELAWWEKGLVKTGAFMEGVGDGASSLANLAGEIGSFLVQAGVEYADLIHCLATGDYNELERKMKAAREQGENVYEKASEASENLILLLSDEEIRQLLLNFPERYWDSLSEVEATRMAGGAAFEIALGILLAAATGGAGAAAMGASMVARLGTHAKKTVSILEKLMVVLKKIRTKNTYRGVTQRKNTHIIKKPESAGSTAKGGTLTNDKYSPNAKETKVGGEPVSLVTGEELLQQTDFTLTGPLSLNWERTYRTSNPYDIGLGHGWTHPLIGWLSQDWRFIYYHDQEGRKIPFPIPQKGQYSTNTAEQIRLTAQEDGLYRLQFLKSQKLKDEQPDRLFKLINRQYRLHALQDSIGNTLQCLHNDHGQIIQLLGDWGKGLRFHYQGKHIIQIDELSLISNEQSEPHSSPSDSSQFQSSRKVSYQYDQQNDLIAISDPADNSERFAYKNHIITQRTLKSGFNFYFEWDQYTIHAKCLHQWGDNDIYDYHFEWEDEKKLSRTIDSNGGILTTHYNEHGLPIKEIDPQGGETQYEYNEAGLLSKTIDPMGATSEYQYNELGLVTQQSDPLGNTQSIEYNDFGQPTQITDANNNIWTREYDERGLLSQLTDPQGNQTQYQYNHYGQPALITNALGQTTQLLWNAQGELLAEKTHDGQTTHYQYNAQGQIQSTRQGNDRPTEYLYDVLGNVTQVNLPNGQSQHFSYNSSGQLIQYTDEAGRKTQYQYDGLSQVRRRIDPMGQTLTYFYDKERNLTGLQNEKGESHQLRYDKNERLIAEVGFDGRQQHYRYNESGHLVEQIDGSLIPNPLVDTSKQNAPEKNEEQAQNIPSDDALVTQFQRNPLGQLIGKATADGEQSRFAYNPSGQLTLAENPQCKVIYDYDSLGNQIEETQKTDTQSQSLIHEYDPLGNRIKTTLPSGQVVAYQYNHQQLFTQVSLDDEIISQIQRDALGREISKQQGQLNSHYHYDPMGRLASHQVSHQKSKNTIIQRGYAYDHAGNLATIDDFKKGATHYQYDALNRLAQVKSFVSEQFAFDPAGNLLAQQNTQDSSNQPANQTQTPQVSGNRLSFLGDRKFEYDTRGNLIKEQRGKGGQLQTEFTYNASNQLVKATKNNAGKQEEYSYRYDALGRRINKTTPEQSIDFVWNGDVLLSEAIFQTNIEENEEQSQKTQSKIYLYEPNSFKPLAIIQNHEIYHYHLDHLGTPQELTHHNGELAWSVHYKAYGNVAKKVVESVENNLRFQGQYYDAETGLHYNRHRYYDPTTARFISLDPIGLLGGNNNYQYANNPTAWIDPLGLVCDERYKRYKLYREQGLSASTSAKLSKTKESIITNPSQILEAPKWETPEMPGRPITSTISNEGLILEQAIDESYQIDKITGNIKPGGFFTAPDTIINQEYLRNNLAVTHKMKEQATHVAKFKFPGGIRVQNSTVGPQKDIDGKILPGKAPQTEILNYSDRKRIQLIELRELE